MKTILSILIYVNFIVAVAACTYQVGWWNGHNRGEVDGIVMLSDVLAKKGHVVLKDPDINLRDVLMAGSPELLCGIDK